MAWLSTHWMPLALLMTVVASASWVWVKAIDNQDRLEKEEETAQRMVDYSGTYDYRTDTFK